MKNLNYLLLGAAGLVLASCSQEDLVSNVGNGDGTANVTITLSTPQIQSRAYSDGTTAKQLLFAVYEVDGSTLTRLSGDDYYTGNDESKADKIDIKKEKTFKLLTDHTYQFVFWAGAPTATGGGDNSPYTVTFPENGNPTFSVDYSKVKANDENLDAFYGRTEKIKVTGNIQLEVPLYRPFAQINVGTNDYYESSELGYMPNQSTISVTNAYSKLDLLTDEATEPKTNQAIRFDYNAIPAVNVNEKPAVGSEKFPVNGYEYLAMAYVLVGKEKTAPNDKDNVTVSFSHKDATSDAITRTISEVPVQRNHRTNIYGQVLTSDANLVIEIKPAYDDPDLEPSALEMAAALGGTVVLDDDFNYSDNDIDRIYFTKDAVVDLNGKTVTGSDNGKDSDGTFLIRNGANVTITGNGTMETSGDYASILVWAQDKSVVTIENGTFKANASGEIIYIGPGGGTIYIKGGTFIPTKDSKGIYALLNCYDQAYKDGIAKFVVTGGTFYNWNPATSSSEPTSPNTVNWVAPGYKSVKTTIDGNDNCYVVVPENSNVANATNARSVINAGGDVFLAEDANAEKGFTLTNDTNIDLNNNSLSAKSNGNYGDNMVIGNGANVTISNGEIKPADDASVANASATIIVKTSSESHLTLNDVKATGIYPVYLNSANENSTITINGGEYYTTMPLEGVSSDKMAPAVYVGKGTTGSTIGGKVTINGGTFGQTGVTNNYLLNVEDVLRKQEGKEPRNFIEVFGGTFINFDPSNNKAEGEGTNFVAEGYEVVKEVKGNDTYYTVVKK